MNPCRLFLLLFGIRSSLFAGDVSSAWRIWSFFAEVSLVRAFVRLGCVLSVLDGIFRNGLTLSRDLELSAQWDAVVSAGP